MSRRAPNTDEDEDATKRGGGDAGECHARGRVPFRPRLVTRSTGRVRPVYFTRKEATRPERVRARLSLYVMLFLPSYYNIIIPITYA